MNVLQGFTGVLQSEDKELAIASSLDRKSEQTKRKISSATQLSSNEASA